jgi:dihydrofolate synthase / folylpolyglutamate synthase
MSANRRPVLAISAALVLGAVVWIRRRQRHKAAEASWASALGQLGAPPVGIPAGCVHDVRRAWFKAWHRKLFSSRPRASPCKFIHVAGTNGKGTTCNALRNGLVALGYRVGLFTSPHVHSPCERIQVGTEPVPWQTLADLTHTHASDMQPWMVPFDRYLVIGLSYFAAAGCDYVILETGIGGLLDSTNYVECPVACIITSISLDHCNLLGSTIGEIAQQKAGIIKPTCKVVVTSSSQHSVALQVLEMAAAAAGTRLVQATPSLDRRFTYSTVASENVGIVEATFKALELDVNGLDLSSPCRWPGRFEEIRAAKGKVSIRTPEFFWMI